MSAKGIQRGSLDIRWILIAVTVVAWILGVGRPGSVGAAPLVLDAEVLESSGSVVVPGFASESVHYAVVHHHRSQDRSDLSAWLRSRGGSPVTFVTKDGQAHQGVLNRLKHCFGRGLLLYADPVSLGEKDLVRLELPREEQRSGIPLR